MEQDESPIYRINYDYKMAMNLFNYIIDELSALKNNTKDQILDRKDKVKQKLLIKSLNSVESLLNDIHHHKEIYENTTTSISIDVIPISPLNLTIEALQIELKKIDKSSNDKKFAEISKTRKRIISKALPPLKNLANHIEKIR